MSAAEPRRYLTHDCDIGRVELVVQSGDNGDWYISIVPEGRKIAKLDREAADIPRLRACVRVTTSGERREHHGVAAAVVALYRAMGGEEAELRPVEWAAEGSAEPLAAEEIAALDVWLADVERTQPPGDKLAVTAVAAVARLRATICARDAKLDECEQLIRAVDELVNWLDLDSEARGDRFERSAIWEGHMARIRIARGLVGSS